MNKKSPKKIIEFTDPEVEHVYVRIPRREMIDVSKDSFRDRVDIDKTKSELALKDYSGRYSLLHEHPVAPEDKIIGGYVAPPSGVDLAFFLSKKYGSKQKVMHIAQRDLETGEVQGYVTLRKTKKTPLIHVEENPFVTYDLARGIADLNEGAEANRLLDKIIRDHKLQIRYTPIKGFKYDPKKLKFVKN